MARQGSLSSYGIPKMESLDTAASMVTAPVPTANVEPAGTEGGSRTSQEPAQQADAAATFAGGDASWVETPPQPVRAAMTPMPAAEPAPAPAAPAQLPAGLQSIVLTLTQPSWVELKRADGSRIESALLPEGTRREYQVEGQGSLRIGNTRGATLEIDGAQVPLAPYTVGNVAQVKLGDVPAR
jgi:cytoskeleton protein RodZ